MSARPTAALALLTLVALAAPAVQSSETQATLDLTTTVAPGEFRAYRVLLRETAEVEFGGSYAGVQTTQPVLPLLAAVERLDTGCPRGCAGALFSYDFAQYGSPLAVVADVQQGPLVQSHGGYDINGGGYFTTFPLDPGEYMLLAASAPAEAGVATLHLKVLGEATVLASQAGESFWARGYDLSESKYDVHVLSARGLYARAWSYSGAEASLEATGSLYGYLGYHNQGGAHWEGPTPSQFGFIQDGEPGLYQALFPSEEWQGPLCAPGLGCDTGFGDTREDPPFALAVDVRV